MVNNIYYNVSYVSLSVYFSVSPTPDLLVFSKTETPQPCTVGGPCTYPRIVGGQVEVLKSTGLQKTGEENREYTSEITYQY